VTHRILILASDPGGVGGVQRVTRALIRAAAELLGEFNVAVSAVWASDDPMPFPGVKVDPGISHSTTAVPLGRKLQFTTNSARFAARWRPTAIIATHVHLAPAAQVASFACRAPHVAWSHGYEVWGPVRPTIRLALRGATRVWSSSRFTAKALVNQRLTEHDRIHFLPYCLSPELRVEPIHRTHADTKSVLSVARLTLVNAYKGVEMLILAWPLVLMRVPEARLRIAGTGDDQVRLAELVARLGLESRVTFLGRCSDEQLADEYRRASVFALPGRARTGKNAFGEGFGLVFLEAAAAGLPVVVGNGGGAPEATRDGETGLVVDAHSPAAVADAIVSLLLDPERAAAMGEAGREWVTSTFSYEAFRDRVRDALADLMSVPVEAVRP